MQDWLEWKWQVRTFKGLDEYSHEGSPQINSLVGRSIASKSQVVNRVH